MNPNQKLGVVKVALDGEPLDIAPGAKFTPHGFSRSVVEGDLSIGFAQKREPAMVECEINFSTATNLRRLADTDNATIAFETDTGQSFVMRNAWLEALPAVTAGQGGKVPLKFLSDQAEEVS